MSLDKRVLADINSMLIHYSDLILVGTILGHLPSGKNNYRLSGQRIFRSKKVIDYEYYFSQQINALLYQYRDVDFPISANMLCLVATVYYKDWRRDVDTILFCDLLQKYNIIDNDRSIRIKILNGSEVDKKNPRVEFNLYKIT